MSWGPPIVNTYGMISGLGTTFENAFDKARLKADEAQAAQIGLQQLNAAVQPGSPSLATGLLSAAQQNANQGTQGPGAGLNTSGKIPSFIQQAADATGVSPTYLTRTAQIESGMNPNAQNPSGADGLFQFIPSTAKQYGVNTRDPLSSAMGAARLASDNANVLRSTLGRDPTDGELYLAHQQGAGGATKLLANPGAPAESIVGRAAVVQNGGQPGMTAGQFASLWTGEFGGGQPMTMPSGGMQTAQAPTPPPPRPQGIQIASADPNFAPQMPAQAANMTPAQVLVARAGGSPSSFPSSANAQPGSRVAPGTATSEDDEETVPSGPGGTAIPGPTRTAQALQPGQVVYPGMPQQAGPPPQVAGSNGLASLSDQQKNVLRQKLANPVTRAQAMQTIQQLQQPDKIELKEAGGMLYRVNTRTGQAAPVQGIGDNYERFDNNGTTYLRNKATQQTQVLVPSSKDETKDPEAYRKVVYARQNWQSLGLPDPTDPQNNAYWKDFATKTLGGGGGVTVNNKLPGAETARDAKIGGAIGEAVAEDIKAGSVAPRKLQTLAILDDANRNGGDDISSGPLGKAILGGKQAMSELFGIDTKGLPESEVTQKVGFELATQAAKSITSRPSQMEFGKALENVPGLLMSKPGRQAMTSILTQQARQDSALSKLAQNKANWDNWQQVKDDFYEAHPIMSPFTGKPFGQQDIEMLAKAAPAQSAPDGQRTAPTAPVKVARPEDAMRLPPGTRFLDPNGVERIRP